VDLLHLPRSGRATHGGPATPHSYSRIGSARACSPPAAASELPSEGEVAAFEWLRAAKSYPDAAGSGDKQAKAKLCCVEIDEVTVAFGPPA